MDNEQQQFLDALEKNEDDVTIRMVYSDWLEERGWTEEAERQRCWPASKRWLVDFVERYAWHDDYEEEDQFGSYRMTHLDLVEMASSAIARFESGEDATMYFGDQEGIMYEVSGSLDEFLKHYAIFTGKPVPPKLTEKIGFRCAC